MSLLDMRPRGAGGGSGAPADATFITQIPNATLTNEQALSLLATGLLKNTTGTGVLSIGAAGTDYLAPAAIGVTVQAWDTDLDTLAGLAKADGNFIVGDGAAWVVESGATARTSLGLGSLAVINSPLPIANGGSGQTAQQAAIDALTNVVAATNEHVLTKDTATGNAIFKAAAGGTTLPVADTQTIVKGSVDATKLLRFEVDGFTAGATRVLTPPNADATIAGLEVANVFTAAQTINGSADAVQLSVKAHSTQNANLMELKNNAGTIVFVVDLPIQGGVFTGINVAVPSAGLNIKPPVFSNTVLSVEAISGQTGSLTVWKNAAGTVISRIDSAGNPQFGQMGISALAITGGSPWWTGSGGLYDCYQYIQMLGTGNIGIIIRGNTSQSADLQQWRLVDETVVTAVSNIGALSAKVVDAVTGATTNALTLGHNSTGTPGVSFGTGIAIQGHSSTTTNQSMGNFTYEWATATHASRKARSKWTVYDTAEREGIRIEASGTAPMLGFYGTAAVAQQTVTGSRGGNAALADLLTKLATLGLIVDGSSA